MSPPPLDDGDIMFSDCPSVRAFQESLLARRFIFLFGKFHQIYNIGTVLGDKYEL